MTSQGVAFAKTTRPAIGTALARERLFTRLDGVAGRTVAWISGPPGAGKTTLAASYVEARRYRCLWYQLDADDADVATFFHYLGHAARKLDPAAPAQLSDLAAMSGADVQTLARGFFRRLFASVRTPFALVLDNLHAVPAASALHAALEGGLGQVPKNCCVIVVSRNEPPASLARARVTGEMVCVGWDELRLEPRELAEVAQLRGHTLAGEALEQYAERTQGWAAGLVLMLEHAKLSGRIAELPGDATPQVIFDYLAGEIFGHFEPRIREFMMRIACLPRMTAQVAEALTGEAKAGRLLLNLAQNGYFVDEVPTDTGRAFQLHPLLRDFLRGRAAQDLPEALGEAWLERAAGLLRDAGQAEDALSLFAESRNWKQLARLLADEAAGWIEQGRFAALEAWLDMLAPEVLERDPRLLLAAGICRARSSPRAAQRAFEQAHEGFGAARDARGMAASARAAIEAAAFALDDAAALDRWIAALGAPQTDVDAAALAWALLLRDPGRDALAPHAARGGPLPRAAAALLRGDLPAARAQLDGLPEASARAKIGAELLRALHGVFEGSHAPCDGSRARRPRARGGGGAPRLGQLAHGRRCGGGARHARSRCCAQRPAAAGGRRRSLEPRRARGTALPAGVAWTRGRRRGARAARVEDRARPRRGNRDSLARVPGARGRRAGARG
jgi:LuxR family transcriptional regulator, maltose regulon positive regulatory protein